MDFHFQFASFFNRAEYIISGTVVTKKWEAYIHMLVWLKNYAFSPKQSSLRNYRAATESRSNLHILDQFLVRSFSGQQNWRGRLIWLA